MPYVQFISDVHCRWDQVQFDPSAQMVVALGDLTENTEGVQWLASCGKPVLYVPGNHEFYNGELTSCIAELENAARGTSVRIMDRRVATAGSWRFLGTTLWTDHNRLDPVLVAGSSQSLNDHKSISVKHWIKDDQNKARYQALRHAFLADAPEHSSLVPAKPKWMNPIISLCQHQDAMAFLTQELAKPWDGQTVVLSHHAPSRHSLTFAGYFSSVEQAQLRKSFDRQLKPHKIGAYSSHLEYLFANHSISLWAHGHLHEGLRYSLYGTDVITNPTGYHEHQNKHYYPSLTLNLDDPSRHSKCLALTLHQSLAMQKEALLLLKGWVSFHQAAAEQFFSKASDFLALSRIYNQSISILLQQSSKDLCRPDFILTPFDEHLAERLIQDSKGRISEDSRSRLLHDYLTLAQSNQQKTQLWLSELLDTSGLSSLGWSPILGF